MKHAIGMPGIKADAGGGGAQLCDLGPREPVSNRVTAPAPDGRYRPHRSLTRDMRRTLLGKRSAKGVRPGFHQGLTNPLHWWVRVGGIELCLAPSVRKRLEELPRLDWGLMAGCWWVEPAAPWKLPKGFLLPGEGRPVWSGTYVIAGDAPWCSHVISVASGSYMLSEHDERLNQEAEDLHQLLSTCAINAVHAWCHPDIQHVSALSDDRAPKSKPRTRRRTRRSPTVERVLLDDGALWVIELALTTPDGQDSRQAVIDRCRHIVREHSAIYWVADPRPADVLIAYGTHPRWPTGSGLVTRTNDAGTLLHACLRPRKGHWRGNGDLGIRRVQISDPKP